MKMIAATSKVNTVSAVVVMWHSQLCSYKNVTFGSL